VNPKRLPYPGLRAFTREESDLFFGRDGCVDSMVDRLAATRFLAVLGASGSGKSSLVRTGLLEALDLGLHPWAGSRWTVADLHPGGQPVRNLAAALQRSKPGEPAAPADCALLATFLRRGPRSLIEWVSGGNLEGESNLLILVDQFEELFRYGNYARQEEAEAFVSLLLESSSAPGVRIHIVVTMRSEFLGACALMPGLAEKINAGLYLTPRMTREECAEAIEGPARVMGFTVERPLVTRLLNDLASFAPWESGDSVDQAERLARRADQLPLMQHVLNRLWARADEESAGANVVLKLADYDGIGGLSGALDAHGTEVLNALGQGRAACVEAVFRSLVSGSSVALAVRRPSRMAELAELAGNRDDVVAVVEAFRAPDCNFLRTSEQQLSDDAVIVDISHESLIRQWTPLRKWLENEARASAAWTRLLAAEERYSRGEGGLLTGLDLGGLAAWWETASPTSAWAARHGGGFDAVQTFLAASRRAEAAQADAESRRQIRERHRLWLGIAGLASALLLALTFSVFAFFRHQESLRVNAQLYATVKQLESANRMALENFDKARSETARAEGATKEAQEALEMANEKEKTISQQNRKMEQMAEGVHKSKTAEEARSVVDLFIFRPTQKDVQIGQHSNAAPSLPTGGKDEGDGATQLIAARAKYAKDSTPENLDALRVAAKARYDALTKIGRQPEADALWKELAADAEKLVGKMPGAAVYRTAWDIVIDQGDSLKGHDAAAAGKAFARSLELAELLPADELYKRLVSYERIGDQLSARGDAEGAGGWFTKEVQAGRRVYSLANTPDNLSSLKIAIDRLYGVDLKLKRQSEADGLQKELIDDAETLVKKTPGAAAYRVAWDVRTDEGDRLKPVDPQSARKAFTRSVELAELLPNDNAPDLHRRLVSYERLGDLDLAADNVEGARSWYFKEVTAARGKFAVQRTADNLDSLRSSTNRLYDALLKLKRQPEAMALQSDLVDQAEKLAGSAPGAAAYRVVWLIRTDQGDRLKPDNPTAARKAYARGMDVAELLPDDNASDLYRRVVSYERLGDQEAADDRTETARVWYTKQVDADRKRYEIATSAENLASFRLSVNRLYNADVKLQRQTDADALQKELAEDAEKLVKNTPGAESYRVALDILIDQGDRLKPSERPAARRIFTHCEQMAELLPQDNAPDLYKRLLSYERLGDQDNADGNSEAARGWYVKEIDVARRRYALESVVENLRSFRIAANLLYQVEVKLHRESEEASLQKELVEDAENLVKKTPGPETYRLAWLIISDQGDHSKTTDPVAAKQAYARSSELAERLPDDNTADLFRKLYSDEGMGDLEAAGGSAEAALGWYTKEVAAARKRFAIDNTVDNLESLRVATNRLYSTGLKLKIQPANDAIQRELADDAEMLVKKVPGDASWREGWDILTDHGGRLIPTDPAAATRAFTRSLELAELLPENTASDQYRRLYSYKNLGDLAAAEGKVDSARNMYAKAAQAARRRYAMEPTADHLASLRTAANLLYAVQVKLKRQNEEDALQKELVDDAESLVKKSPGDPAYMVAWDILTDRGDRLRATDAAEAEKLFTRSAELADLLPATNNDNLYKRLFSYERIGGQEYSQGRFENARKWYTREVEMARRRFSAETSTDNLRSLIISTNNLCDALVKLKLQPEADALEKSTTESAETLLSHSQTDADFDQVARAYTGAASRDANPDIARQYLLRGVAIAQKIGIATPDNAFARYVLFNSMGDSLTNVGNPNEARNAFLEASLSLKAYVDFRTATPPRLAAADNRTIASLYGSLSFVQLLAGNFEESAKTAQRGLDAEPGAAWIEANLAHALLLSGNQSAAIEHYMKARKGTVNNRPILDATAEDFGILKKLGFDNPAMDTILKQMAQ